MWQGDQVVQAPFIKQKVADWSFYAGTYNNCKIKVYFLLRYTSVATNLNKVGLLEVGLSGI